MPIRMTGLISNLDTEGIIKELMGAQNLKKTKIENKITKLEWKQEKWKELNTKIYKLYTDSLADMKTEGTYLTKKASSSNESKLKRRLPLPEIPSRRKRKNSRQWKPHPR